MSKIKYNLIVAYCNNFGIGYKNKLPWSFKNDMQHFREKTIGNGNNAVIMGRNTLFSIPNNYLPNRTNYCITNTPNIYQNKYNNIHFYNCFDKLEDDLLERNFDDVWVIGGNQIYKHYLINNKIDTIYSTHIKRHYIIDTLFPYQIFINFYCVERKVKKEQGVQIEFLKYNRKL